MKKHLKKTPIFIIFIVLFVFIRTTHITSVFHENNSTHYQENLLKKLEVVNDVLIVEQREKFSLSLELSGNNYGFFKLLESLNWILLIYFSYNYFIVDKRNLIKKLIRIYFVGSKYKRLIF